MLPSAPVLAVIGAHFFTGDRFDPVRAAVHNVRWSSVLLVEANPAIARHLNQSIHHANPLPATAKGSVHVVNEGVCPGLKASLPFYTLPPLKKTPRWASQTGSFNRRTIGKSVEILSQMNGMSAATLDAAIDSRAQHVPCGSLEELLEREAGGMPSVLQIDIEGFDCRVVAAQNWCRLRPQLLVFESFHCEHEDEVAALKSLARDCGDGKHYVANKLGMNNLAVLQSMSHTPPLLQYTLPK